LGLLLVVVVLSASVQDRGGAKSVLLDTYLRTRVRFVFADGGFAGRLLEWATRILATTISIVRKPADQRGFRGDPAPVGGRADIGLVDRAPTTRTGLRTPPGHFGGHDPVGGDQHHHPPDRSRRDRDPSTTTLNPTRQLIFSNTLSA
jgi:hypothetical protein